MAADSYQPEYVQFLDLNPTYSSNYLGPIASAKVTVSASSTSVPAGTPVALTASIVCANGTPVSGTSVDFYLGPSLPGTTPTNTNGKATFTYTPASAGASSIKASLASAPSVVSSPVNVVASAPKTTTTKAVTVLPSELTLTASKTTIPAGGVITLTATAKYANGTHASGYAVAFYSNGTIFGTASTSTAGTASITYSPSSPGVTKIAANLVSAPSTISNVVQLNVTAPVSITPSPSPSSSSSNTMLYALVAVVVVVVVVVVAAVVALRGRGKKAKT